MVAPQNQIESFLSCKHSRKQHDRFQTITMTCSRSNEDEIYEETAHGMIANGIPNSCERRRCKFTLRTRFRNPAKENCLRTMFNFNMMQIVHDNDRLRTLGFHYYMQTPSCLACLHTNENAEEQKRSTTKATQLFVFCIIQGTKQT